ncbi:MAG: hypothetical protein ABL996_10850 [Micropepsaceae bacterium]
MTSGDRTFRGSVLAWITKFGPFIEDDRQNIPDDYFEFRGLDVTDQGLGEAARRVLFAQAAGSVSFDGSTPDCGASPLTVQHGLSDEVLGNVDVRNLVNLDLLELWARTCRPEPTSWLTLSRFSHENFLALTFAENAFEPLSREPFHPAACRQICFLLQILDEYSRNKREHGERSTKCQEILSTHFQGGRARFSDESPANKREFENELTFRDPDDHTRDIFCPWHGKVNTPKYRIHFQWPVPRAAAKLKIAYVGPKLTKK